MKFKQYLLETTPLTLANKWKDENPFAGQLINQFLGLKKKYGQNKDINWDLNTWANRPYKDFRKFVADVMKKYTKDKRFEKTGYEKVFENQNAVVYLPKNQVACKHLIDDEEGLVRWCLVSSAGKEYWHQYISSEDTGGQTFYILKFKPHIRKKYDLREDEILGILTGPKWDGIAEIWNRENDEVGENKKIRSFLKKMGIKDSIFLNKTDWAEQDGEYKVMDYKHENERSWGLR